MPRTISTAAVGLATALALTGCGGSSANRGRAALSVALPARTMGLSSPDFDNGAMLPVRFSCDGDGSPPGLRWSRVPRRTAEIALTVEDLDAPHGPFLHWVVLGLSAGKRQLPTAVKQATLRLAKASSGKVGYEPPCPPRGSAPHRYVFTVYALRRPLGMPYGAEGARTLKAITKDAKARGVLVARYRRA